MDGRLAHGITRAPLAQPLLPTTTDVYDKAVEWCLAFATIDQIFVVALIRRLDDDAGQFLSHGPRGSLQPVWTDFSTATDGARVTALTGTPDGRIFLGSNHGHVWEMECKITETKKLTPYEKVQEQLDGFYDGDEDPPVILDARTGFLGGLKRAALGATTESQPRAKARKLNSSMSSAVLPKFVHNTFSYFDGNRYGTVSKIVVDPDRNKLYAITSTSWVTVWTIGKKDQPTTYCSGFNVETTAVEYLQRVSRGQKGGGAHFALIGPTGSAQAAVGGSEGARAILKQHDSERNGSTSKSLAPISVHAIPLAESQSLTTVIVTASGLRLYASASETSMKLHHIRAAIPTSDAAMFDDDVGGMKPTSAVPGIVGVGGACYWNRTLVVAATELKRDIGTRAITTVYTATRDERYKEATNGDGEKVLVKPSGISEAVSWPLGDSLQGGLVYDMATIPPPPRPSKSLQTYSKTPTEAELATSLTPAFVPSTLLQSSNATNGKKSATALVKQVNPLLVLGTYACNLLGAPTTFRSQLDRKKNNARYVHFRISKRDATRGFSSTAADKRRTGVSGTTPRRSSASSKNSKPALLRKGLLHPEVKAIKDLAAQCFEEPSNLVALSPSGAHMFEQGTVLTRFIDILASADGIGGKLINDFFLDYGAGEACSLCLGVAIGIGPASALETVRTKAKNIAFERGSWPMLQPIQGTRGALSNFVFTNANDDLVPDGYEFRPSVLCQGLTTLVSRLIRPIWHKPIVVVTEGRIVQDDRGKHPTPVKVELLLDDTAIGELLSPLISLEHTLRDMFVPAIKDVPGASGLSNRMDTDDAENLRDNHYLTDSQQYNRSLTVKTAVPVNLTARDRDEVARLLEEKNIHSIYRLVARLKQLLQLIAYLLRIDDGGSLGAVNWGLLHGVTTAQLVENPEGQDRLERLLNGLLTASTNASLRDASAADRFASSLATDCFYFFSPASRDTYEGLKHAAKAATFRPTSQEFNRARVQAREFFLSAATNWHKPSLVIGSTGKSNGSLFEARSPLIEAVNAMMALTDVVGCVQVCFKTAANFQTKTPNGHNGTLIVPQLVVPPRERLPWEISLYHNKRDMSGMSSPQNNRRRATGSRTTPRSPMASQVVKATAQDAVELCYNMIFQNLSQLLRGENEDLGRTMLSTCLSTSDKPFLDALFSFLFNNGFKEHLFDIDLCAPLIEWLRERASHEDLWCCFTVQQHFADAGKLAFEIAVDPSKATPLADRINWLNRAVSSFKSAPGYDNNVTEGEDKLALAKLQLRISDKLGHPREPIKDSTPTAEESELLQTKLTTWNTLFNDYCLKFNLHEECLYILHANRHFSEVIKTLWMNVISIIVFPCATSDQETYSNLMKFANEADAAEHVKLLHPGDDSNTIQLFEACRWGKLLQNKISDLGRDLYGTGADYVFPVEFLLATLEGALWWCPPHSPTMLILTTSSPPSLIALRKALRGNNTSNEGIISPGWALVTLADGGIPFMKIWESYDAVSPDRLLVNGPDFEGMIETVCAVLELLDIWLSKISTDAAARTEFSQAKSSGSFYSKVSELRQKIEAIPATPRERLLARLRGIEENTSTTMTYFG